MVDAVRVHNTCQTRENRVVRWFTVQSRARAVAQHLQTFALPVLIVRDLSVAHFLPVDDVVAIAAPRVEHRRIIAQRRRQNPAGEREGLRAFFDRGVAMCCDGIHMLAMGENEPRCEGKDGAAPLPTRTPSSIRTPC